MVAGPDRRGILRIVQFQIAGVNAGAAIVVDGGGTYTTSYTITQGAGPYTITAILTPTTPTVTGSSDNNLLTVSKEDATVTPSSTNPLAVQVSVPGGYASSITLKGGHSGNGGWQPGRYLESHSSRVHAPSGGRGFPDQLQPCYNQRGGWCPHATATCLGVPVNVYDVNIGVGGSYYTGSADSVLAVYDPSLGFVTGGGTILHNGARANFDVNVKYLKSG